MTCKMSNRIDDYVEGLLSKDIKSAIEDHLNTCVVCKGIYNEKIFLNNILKESFDTTDVEFTSSRSNIIQAIDKDMYKYNSVKKIFRHITSRKRIYATLVASLALCIIGGRYSYEALTTKKLEVVQNRSNTAKTIHSFDASQKADDYNLTKKGVEAIDLADDSSKVIAQAKVEDNDIVITKESENKYYLKLSKDGKMEEERELSSDFGRDINFDSDFVINVKDYNGDNKKDFLLGQKIDESNFMYIMYSISNKDISKIDFERETNIISCVNDDVNNYSPDFDSNGYDTINIPYYEEGTVTNKLFVWNRKENKFIFEKTTGDDDLIKDMPQFSKVDSYSVRRENNLEWKNSKDKRYSAAIYEKSILIKDSKEDEKYKYKIKDGLTKYDILDITFDKKDDILVIVGDGEDAEGGDLYKLNINTGEYSILKLNASKRELIVKVSENGEDIIYYLKVYEDSSRTAYHIEKCTISKNGGTPKKVEIVNNIP